MASFTQRQNYNSVRGTAAREPPFGRSLRLEYLHIYIATIQEAGHRL